MPDSPARCGYRGCDAELPSPGPRGGLPRTFCRATRWDADRSCGRVQELSAELEQTRRNATAAQTAAAARDAELPTQLTAALAERDTALQHGGRDHLRGHGVVLVR